MRNTTNVDAKIPLDIVKPTIWAPFFSRVIDDSYYFNFNRGRMTQHGMEFVFSGEEVAQFVTVRSILASPIGRKWLNHFTSLSLVICQFSRRLATAPPYKQRRRSMDREFDQHEGWSRKDHAPTQLAHAANSRSLRTLAVDLDPQSNLSQAILSPEVYVKLLKDKKPTVAAIFENYLPPFDGSSSPKPLAIKDVIIKKAGYWQGTTLDLIPSRLELSHTLKNPTSKERRLAKALVKYPINTI